MAGFARDPRVHRIVNAIAGAALLVNAFVFPSQAVEQGGRTPEPWALGVLGITFLIQAVGGGTAWAAATRATNALLIGVVGQLGITSPLWLQHLRLSPSEPRGAWDAMFAIMIAGQLVMMALSVKFDGARARDLIPAGWRARTRSWHVILGLLLFVACAVHLTRYVNRDKTNFAAVSYAAQLGVTAVLVAGNLFNVLLIFALVPVEAARGIRERFARMHWDRKIPWILAAWTVVASVVLGWVALDQVPHIPDEVCYVFQAECLARGMFFGKAPPSPDAFKVYLVPVESGRWFATTSLGWPAVLALGSAIGAPWLVNPLLGGLGVLLAHALTRRLLGLKTAHLVALLLSISPWLLYLSASYMTHSVSLVLMLAVWLCVARARDAAEGVPGEREARAGGWGQMPAEAGPGSPNASKASGWGGGGPAGPSGGPHGALWCLLGGALLGWLFLVRQLDAVLLGGITGLGMLGVFGRRMPWSTIAVFVIGAAAVAALVFPYNAMMTGNAFTFPLNDYMDKLWYPGINRLGFGADIGNPAGGWGDLDPFPGHGLRDVLLNTNQNLYATNFELFGWGIGSFFFAAMHLFFGKKKAVDRLMFFTIIVLLLGYHLYWFSGGPDFGARYWYLMIYPLVVLTVRGIETCTEALGKGSAGETAPDRMGVVVSVLVITTLAVFIPWRAVTRYKDYRGFHADYRKLEASLDPRALVFVKSKSSEKGMQGDADYSSAFIRNSPRQDEARPIFAQDLGDAENAKLRSAFPDRPVVYVTGRSMGTGPTRIETGTTRPR